MYTFTLLNGLSAHSKMCKEINFLLLNAPVSNVKTEGALVTVVAVPVADLGADVTLLAVPELKGEDGSALTKRVEGQLALLQHILHLRVGRLKQSRRVETWAVSQNIFAQSKLFRTTIF